MSLELNSYLKKLRLEDEIKLGESKVLEFKEKLPNNQSITKSIIAFSNTAGGKLIIGVNDDRNIIGVEEDIFDLQDKISSIVYESCYPNIIPEIYTKNIEGQIILLKSRVKRAIYRRDK